MDPLIPQTAAISRLAEDALTFNATLKNGGWWYADARPAGEANISLWFDFSAIFMLVLLVGYSMYMGKRKSLNTTNIKGVAGMLEKTCYHQNSSGVDFITKDEYATLFAVFFISTMLFFKIIGGAPGVNAGYIFVVVLSGLFVRFTRQIGKGMPEHLCITATAIFGIMLAFIAYTETFSDKINTKRGLYITATVFVLIAACFKVIATIRPDWFAPNDRKSYAKARAEAIVNSDFAFDVSVFTVAVVGGSFLTFIFTEAITVALSATKWYAVPFYALYVIPIYTGIVIPIMDKVVSPNKTPSMATAFNMIFSIIGFFILFLLQSHACSLPSNKVNEYASGGKYCYAGWGLDRTKESDADGVKVKVGATIALEVLSAIFVTFAYASMLYSNNMTDKAVEQLCGNLDAENKVIDNNSV